MSNCCANYFTLPDIQININCDTIFAINLRAFNLSDKDELIFAIKNYNYVDSDYVFLLRASNYDMDENGEVLFKIPSKISQQLHYGSFYTFGIMVNALDVQAESYYLNINDSVPGRIILKYGIQSLLLKSDLADLDYEVTDVRLELIDDDTLNTDTSGIVPNNIIGLRLEAVSEEDKV